MPKILMAESKTWNYRIQTGGRKYAKRFLKEGWSVFWLSTFLNINRIVRRREDDRALIQNWRDGLVQPEPGLTTYTPFSWLPFVNFPFLRSRLVANNALKFTYPPLKGILNASGFESPDVLWLTIPRPYSILDLVDANLLVYRMADNAGAFVGEPKLSIQLEEEICRRADVVFATAHTLVEKAREWTDNVYYLPNGVDFDFFTSPGLALPPDLARISKPRVLYVGMIDTWFDFGTFEVAARELDSYSFIIIGPCRSDNRYVQENLESVRQLPNVHVLGSRPFEQVRNYMSHSDVGIIPFESNELTNSVNPIKLFEYLASGLQVIARQLQEIESIEAPALLYDTPEEFTEKLKMAVNKNIHSRETRIRFAESNSWQSRFEQVLNLIEERLKL